MSTVVRRAAFVLALAAVAVLGVLGAKALLDRGGRAELSVEIAGRTVHVAEGLTLAEAAASLAPQPRRGDLLDVEGKVLRRGAIPGGVLLNGHSAPPSAVIHNGDRVDVVDGLDRREPLSRQILRVARGMPSNPQFALARVPGSQVVVRGRDSHKLVSTRFYPSGAHPRVERAVALTFDDGPSPEYTPLILSMLRKLQVRATFFVVGYLADRYPSLVRQELRAGMVVGNHSYNHPEVPPFDELPKRLIEDEIALGEQSLSRVGARPRLFRPPGGSFSKTVVRTAEVLNERTVLWSIDPGDWQPGVKPRQIARRVLAAVRPGSIVILHDGGGDRSATVAALPAIVKGIRKKGLRLVAISAR
jgi:peptidoglycan/xylan/chitin deacetylase (PgdA/CDA1 family)